MTNYLLTNLGLSVLALSGLFLMRTAPPRLKLWVCLAGAVAWCIPWPTLSSLWQTSELYVNYVRIEGLQSLPPAIADLVPASAATPIPWDWIAASASAFGLLLFAARIVAHHRRQGTLRNTGKLVTDGWRRAQLPNADVPIHVVDGLENAFVSGYVRPQIWIGESQLTSPALASILRHELAHIRQHDNLILLAVILLTDVFWWNPLVRVLTRQARRYVELSCDLACQKASPGYRDELASELLNREYRTLESTLISPIFWKHSFNVVRIRELARETSMKLRHFFLLGLLMLAGSLLVSNSAVSKDADEVQQIVTHLTVTTITPAGNGGVNTKSLETEIVAESEIKILLQLAETADVEVETHMENDYRRVVVIESSDLAETRKVLAAFENTGLDHLYNNRVVRDMGRPILLDIDFQAPGEEPYSLELVPNVGQWTGVTVGDYRLRIRPDLLGAPGEQTVLLSTQISRIDNDTVTLVATPSVQTELNKAAVIEFGYEIVGGVDSILSLTLVPRLTR